MPEEGHARYRIGDFASPEPTPQPKFDAAPSRKRPWWSLAVACACWLFAGAMLILAFCLWHAPITFWPMHLFVYLPRWFLALPLAFLIPAAILTRRLWLAPLLLVATIVLIGPVLGFHLPWRSLIVHGFPSIRLRMLTCNIDGIVHRRADLSELIAKAHPDIMVFQEARSLDVADLPPLTDWYTRAAHGLLVVSRFPIERTEFVRVSVEPRVLAFRHDINVHGQVVHLVTLHLETPREGIEILLSKDIRGIARFREVFETQRRESEGVSKWVAQIGGPLLIGGDFNLTADSPIFRRYWSRYTNAFSVAGLGFGYTRYAGKYVRARIDHILTGPGWNPAWCWVGPDIGSDHLPVLADLEWVGAADEADTQTANEAETPPSPLQGELVIPAGMMSGEATVKPAPSERPPNAPAGVTDHAEPKGEPIPVASIPSPKREPEVATSPTAVASAASVPPATSAPASAAPPVRETPVPVAEPTESSLIEPPAEPAEPQVVEPREARVAFRRELQHVLDRLGSGAAPMIQDLCKQYGATSPSHDPATRDSATRLDRRVRVHQLRSQGVSEPAILLDLAAFETKLIGARKGPRNASEALIRAARSLLTIPVD